MKCKCLSPSIHSQNTQTSCLQPGLIVSFREQQRTQNSQVSVVAIQLRLRYSQSLKPCKLQKPNTIHQSSFCWIYLPLLTLSIIRSSCPPSHHWTSLEFHFVGLNPVSLVGLSGWPGEGRYPKHINWSLRFLRDRFLDPSSSPHTLHHWVPSYRHVASPTIADDRQLYLSFQPDDPTVAARISGCLADISAWMKEHHLQLNLAKTELLVFPATPTLQHDFTIQLGSSTITQWWSVTKYNYFVTVLKYIFQVSVLYWSSFILSNFYFYFTTFQSIRSYFLLHYIS